MLGNSNAQAEIGYLYLIGKNYHRICLMLVSGLKAAAQGNFVAHFYTGRMYQNGDGVEKIWKKPGFIYLMQQKVE